jgi:hypothetical protein
MLVARWDLDKTYLRTDFDSVRALVRTALERPDHKQTVPGAATLVRELARAGAAIHILSGSPEQLRGRIVQKLRLDGVAFASLTLKPNLQNLLRLRLRAIRGQLGYKLPALLRGRCELPRQRLESGALVSEILLGDDAEADALVYSLYADVCSGEVDATELATVLQAGAAYADEIADALRFASGVARGAVVRRILIHLDRQSSPASFDRFGARVVPFYNYLQAALVLHEDGWLDAAAVATVARDLVQHHDFDGATLARCYQDLLTRGHASARPVPALVEACAVASQRSGGSVGHALAEMGSALTALAAEPPTGAGPPVLPRIDYRAAARRLRDRPRRRRS